MRQAVRSVPGGSWSKQLDLYGESPATKSHNYLYRRWRFGIKSVTVTVAAAPVAACGAGGTLTYRTLLGTLHRRTVVRQLRRARVGSQLWAYHKLLRHLLRATNGQKSGVINILFVARRHTGNLRNFTGSHKGLKR